MSFDPYGYDPNKPPDSVQPPPDSTAPIPYPMGGPSPDYTAHARERAQLPGVFLIALGVLNLLWVLFLVYLGLGSMFLTPEKIAEAKLKMGGEQRRQFEELEEKLKEAGHDMGTLLPAVGTGFTILGGISLFTSVLMILGGIRMVQLRNYGLCVFAALLTAVPLASGSACCCLGEGVGIWAIVVLLSNEVRAAFR